MSLFSITIALVECVYITQCTTETVSTPPYTIVKNQTVGAEVRGLNLSQPISVELIEQLNKDIYEHQLLLFRKQGVLSPEQQIKVAGYFGDEFDERHEEHQKAGHPFVYIVSNDEKEGFVGAGDQGMHIDGFFNSKPHKVVIYHGIKAATHGKTIFADSYRILSEMEPFRFKLWDRLWTAVDEEGFAHPVIYQHPITKRNVIAANPNFVSEIIRDYGRRNETVISSLTEVERMLREIEYQIMRNRSRLYFHTWEEGDLIITDNLSLLHLAEPDTQLPPEDIGVRILHRVSVIGTNVPRKAEHMNDEDKQYTWGSTDEDTEEDEDEDEEDAKEYNDADGEESEEVDNADDNNVDDEDVENENSVFTEDDQIPLEQGVNTFDKGHQEL